MRGEFKMIPTVALTGGIGAGKSVVASYLRGRGVPVYDSDSMTKALYDKDAGLVGRLEASLGLALRRSDGSFDRKALAAAIFSGSEARAKAEALIHPAVLADFLSWKESRIEEIEKDGWCFYQGGAPFVVIESAIIMDRPLFRPYIDYCVAVDAPLELRVERAAARDLSSKEAVRKRVMAQKACTADWTIVNDSDMETLRQRTDKVFKSLYLQIISGQA